VQHRTETEAVKEIEGQLARSPRHGAKAETEVEAGGEADADTDGDDAAVADEAASQSDKSPVRKTGHLVGRHSGAARSVEPGISRFRVWSFRTIPE
jgi:hypothetical protein